MPYNFWCLLICIYWLLIIYRADFYKWSYTICAIHNFFLGRYVAILQTLE